MRTFFCGDISSDTGPAIVNKNYKKYLPKDVEFIEKNGKVIRTIYSIYYVIICNVVLFSGISRLNKLLIYICKLFHKKVLYLMHGSVAYENQINKLPNQNEENLEIFHLNSADLILCVSPYFTNFCQNYYKRYSNKFLTLTNGIDWSFSKNSECVKDKKSICIVGGGVPRKRVIRVCEAIDKLCNKGFDLKLKVFGFDSTDTPEIKKYQFVEYKGNVPQEELRKYMESSIMFIQNSVFDSFAMAPIEALTCGCNILCSKEVGCMSIITTVSENDLIINYDDVNEIEKKIHFIIENPNNQRLMNGLNKELTSFSNRSLELMRIIEKVVAHENIS